MNIRPIIVQSHSSGIRVSGGLQAKPVLDFTFLPVERRQFGRERGELRIVRRHRRLQNQILRIVVLFKNVVVVENAFCG